MPALGQRATGQATGTTRAWRRALGGRGRRLLLLIAIGALVGLVAALGLEVRHTREERAALQAHVAKVAAEATAIQVALNQAEVTTDTQEANLAAIAAVLEAQRQEAATLRGRLARGRVEAAQLRTELGEQQAMSAQRQQASGQTIAALTTQAAEQRQQLEDQSRQLEDQRQHLEAREADLARLNEQAEAMTQRIAAMEALAGRLRQMLGLPAARGPAGGDEDSLTAAMTDPVDAGRLEAELAELTVRSQAATRDLAYLERALQERINNLRALTAAGQRRLSAEAVAAAPIGRPVPGYITSDFGMRESPIDTVPRFHGGVDIATNMGTPVQATREGVVIMAGDYDNYGLTVMVRHAAGFETLYGHNSKILVRPGERVERGQPLALSGNSGASTGPHVHYEVRYQGTSIDPAPFLNLKAG